MRMSADEIAMFTKAVEPGGHYLEYGAGGSTRFAARLSQVTSITSVESDPRFVNEHLLNDPDIQEAKGSGRLRFLLADIGETGEWGYPTDRSLAHLWPNYALCPYLRGYRPDIVLVDGRFRVACTLVALLQAPRATILLHDFTSRPRYHVLKRFLVVEDTVDTLIRCRRDPQMDEDAARRLLSAYMYSPSDLSPIAAMLKRCVVTFERKPRPQLA